MKKVIQYMRRGKAVYSTVYIPGANLFDINLLGKYTFPPESVVFIDEVGMIWDNRNFKAFELFINVIGLGKEPYSDMIMTLDLEPVPDIILTILPECICLFSGESKI